MKRALLVLSAITSLTACSSTEPNTIEVTGKVESIRPGSGVPDGLFLLVADANFSREAGLSSPIYIVVDPSTDVYFSQRAVPASDIKVGAYIHAVVKGNNVADSRPQLIGASRIDISNVVATNQLH